MPNRTIEQIEEEVFTLAKQKLTHQYGEVYDTVYAISYKNKKKQYAKAYFTLMMFFNVNKTEDRLNPIKFFLRRHTRYNKKYISGIDGIDDIPSELYQKVSVCRLYIDKMYLGNYSNYKFYTRKKTTKRVYHSYNATLKGMESSISLPRSEQEVKRLIKYVSEPDAVRLVVNDKGYASVVDSDAVLPDHTILDMETSQKEAAKLMRDIRKFGVNERQAYTEDIPIDNTAYSEKSARDTMVVYRKYKRDLSMTLSEEEYNLIVEKSYREFLGNFIDLLNALPANKEKDIRWTEHATGR